MASPCPVTIDSRTSHNGGVARFSARWLYAVPTLVRMRLRGTRFAGLYAASHVRLYRLTGGRLGGTLPVVGHAAAPLLLLTTTGRVSGQPRTTPLLFVRHGENFVVIAANAGHLQDPAWWRNLVANPTGTIQVRSRTYAVTARLATDEERVAVMPALLATYPPLATYESATERQFPVVMLTPGPAG